MKAQAKFFLLLFVLIAAQTTQLAPDMILPKIVATDATHLINLLKQPNSTLKIIDFRSPEQFQACHITGALPIPLKHLAYRSSGWPRNTPIAIYGNDAADIQNIAVYNLLSSLGFETVYLYPDGVQGWQQHQYPVEGQCKK